MSCMLSDSHPREPQDLPCFLLGLRGVACLVCQRGHLLRGGWMDSCGTLPCDLPRCSLVSGAPRAQHLLTFSRSSHLLGSAVPS